MVYYAEECLFGKGKKLKDGEEEANISQEDSSSDSDPPALMATTDDVMSNSQKWYLDIGCINNMNERRDWIIDFDASKKISIKLDVKKSIIV